MPRRLAMLLLMVCFGMSAALAQVTVTGTVVDANSDPLYGVSVIVKGSKTGAATNMDGEYSLQAKKNDVIIFRYIGMTPVEVKVGDKTVIDVTMQEEVGNLDEVVVVGYGTAKRGAVTSAVSTVSSAELLKAPTMSMSNVVGSRVSGIAAVQLSGQPGKDQANLTLRGQSGIIYVIDGVRRDASDFNNIDPNEVENVSVLKDASAVAVYGLDANGVIIVTTKQGSAEKTQISYTGTVGWSNNAMQQKWLDGPSYAYWFNRAYAMDMDLPWNENCYPVFTQQHVADMRAGVNGWGNTNWYDEAWGTGFRTSHNVTASGGTERYKFFASLGYLKEDGNLDGYGFERFNLRSNLDAKITNNLTFKLGISGRLQNSNEPYLTADPDGYLNIPEQIIRSLPFLPRTMEKDGTVYNVGSQGNSMIAAPFASTEESGYRRANTAYVATNFTLRYDAPFLKGLYAQFTGAYDTSFSFGKTLQTPFNVMNAKFDTSDIGKDAPTYGLVKYTQPNDIALSESAARYWVLTTQTSVGYNNNFNGHNVGAMVLAETRESFSNSLGATGYGLDFLNLDELSFITNQGSTAGTVLQPKISGASGRSRAAGFVFRGNYNYNDKYFAEFTYRYDGSYLFGGMNKRWVSLPGVSVGWRIDREDFFHADWVQNLKLRVGYGQTATTAGLSAFQWRNTMGITNNNIAFGGIATPTITPSVLGNPYLTWAKADNYNIGIDALLFNGLLGIEADVFYKYEHDKIASTTGNYPPSMGGYYFNTGNVNAIDYRGFDLTFTHNNRVADFNYGVKLIWSFAYARWVKYVGDSPNLPEWQQLTGKQVGSKRGMIFAGFYKDYEDIANSPTAPQNVRPGYAKYVDINGDGKITAPSHGAWGDDDGYFGKSHTPKHTGSLNLFGSWRGIDLDMLWSWGLDCDVALTGQYTQAGSAYQGVQDHTSYTKPFYQGGNSPVYLLEGAWTPENPNAEFPRLEIPGLSNEYSNNNGYASTLWYRNGNYLRLKTAQIGYTFPQKLIGRSGITKLRVYVEGYNLLTFSQLNKYNIDPESPAVNNGYYPQQRTFSIGVNLAF